MAASGSELPAELQTPPLGLVALIGTPSVHAAVGAHLRSELRPPLHRRVELAQLRGALLTPPTSLSVASVDAAAQLFPVRKPRGETFVQARALAWGSLDASAEVSNTPARHPRPECCAPTG